MNRILALVLAVALSTLAAAPALAQRTSVSRDFPRYDNGGKPDLTIDPQRFESQMEIVDRFFDPSDCAISEGTVGGSGYRRLLRFDTVIINAGGGDLRIGSPTDPNNPYASWFVFAICHQHYHIRGFSNYVLYKLDGTVAAPGHKQAFCLEDILKYSNDASNNRVYTCGNQGITVGWADWYFKQLSGQWIDITGVPEGDYIVHTEMNASHTFDEGENRYPDFVELRIHVPDPRNKVAIDTSALQIEP